MRKTKTQKIIYAILTVILAVILAAVLLTRFGIVDFKKEINRAVNSDFYWESEPFGELEAVWYLECDTEKLGDEYTILSFLRSSDERKEYSNGLVTFVKDLKNLKYRDIDHIYELYTYNSTAYTAIFVPNDCQSAKINGESVDVHSGKINTPEGEIEFKYITATYKSPHDSRKPGVDKYVLYSEKGKAYDNTENWED